MAKYLLWADTHNRYSIAEEVFAKFPNHTKILLGDYFDFWHDDEHIARKTAIWLKSSLAQKDRIHLLGNHDAAYAYCANSSLMCPGWTHLKNRAIRSILTDDILIHKLEVFHYIEEGNWLISHAGFTLPNLFGFKHPAYMNKNARFEEVTKFSKEELLAEIEKESKNFKQKAYNNNYHHFMYQGTRMGKPGHGGPFWIHRTDFTPIKHFNQIVGHTPLVKPACCYLPNAKKYKSINWFMDTVNRHYGLLEDGNLSFHRVDGESDKDFLDEASK